MSYADYSSYLIYGSGQLDADSAGVWLTRAEKAINRLTLNRATLYADELADELADACCRIADLMAAQDAVRQSSQYGALASASTDGYSESFAAGGVSASTADEQARHILADALGPDLYGLLWLGV